MVQGNRWKSTKICFREAKKFYNSISKFWFWLFSTFFISQRFKTTSKHSQTDLKSNSLGVTGVAIKILFLIRKNFALFMKIAWPFLSETWSEREANPWWWACAVGVENARVVCSEHMATGENSTQVWNLLTDFLRNLYEMNMNVGHSCYLQLLLICIEKIVYKWRHYLNEEET